MNYRLLIDYEALDVLASLKKPVQRLIHQRLRQIQDFPSHWATTRSGSPVVGHCMSALSAIMPSPIGKTSLIGR
jgi:hypothetical protein